MFHKLTKVGVSKVGNYLDVHEDQKDDLISRGIIEEEGFEENPEAPKDQEVKSEPGVTSIAGIINDKSAVAVAEVVNPATVEALETLKVLAADLAEKEAAHESAKAEFEQAKADFDAEKVSFEAEKAEFEQAKADFLSSKTETIVEPAKGKPGPKAKETK